MGQVDGVGPRRGNLATPLLLTGHPEEPEGPTRLLSVRQVADMLGLCTKTIYELVARGVLPHVRLLNTIRFRPDDLKTYMAEAAKGSSAPEAMGSAAKGPAKGARAKSPPPEPPEPE